ncbi:MAG TPA: prephenate dehydrogenase [Candidatus Goldiibacteriota bacterium]|nr:prephenate dehydrogenase [Candidatus Goldiibacteriota bacterium]
MKIKFSKVAIIGMGFMGGSLGRDILSLGISRKVTGIGRNEARLRKALAKRACTDYTRNFETGVKDADLVVIALPVLLIPPVFSRIRPFLAGGSVVTDMGSTKADIAVKIGEMDKDSVFVGSHPMAGSEKTGIDNIKGGLYKGATCIITPYRNYKKTAVRTVETLWKAVGMNTVIMDPAVHDRAAARISHFPHLAAFVITNMARKEIHGMPQIIGPGFRDMTRIAASGEEIWAEIFMSNKKEMLANIDKAIEEFDALSQMIYMNKQKELVAYIRKSRQLRERIR